MVSLYEEILTIAKSYMGIAAVKYIERRCRIVLSGSEQQKLDTDKLERVIKGVKMTAKVYMSEYKAALFVEELEALKNKRKQE